MMLEVLQQSLLPEQRAVGLFLEEDAHIVTLKHGDKVVARFSAQGATVEDIRLVAQQYLETAKAVEIKTLPQCLACAFAERGEGHWHINWQQYSVEQLRFAKCKGNVPAEIEKALAGKCMAWSERK